MITTDKIAEKEKQNAIDKNFPDPYFDFREYYSKGQEIYYAYINDFIGEKENIKLKIRTVYARTLIGYEENACCHMIGYKNKEQIFQTKSEAEAFLKTIKVTPKYG